MNQRITLIVASALTAFFLVLIAGVGLTVAVRSVVAANAATQMQSNAVAQPVALVSDAIATQLSPDHAAQIALNIVANAQLLRTPELVNLQGTVAYEVALNTGNVYVDANTGKILFNGTTNNSAISTTTGNRQRVSEHNESNGGHDD